VAEFTFTESEEFELPSYRDKGNIIVEVIEAEPGNVYGKWTVERSALGEGSTFWISEGMGIDYWVDLHQGDIPHEGIWVFEGVHGEYIRGEWGFTDDDEEWEFDCVRPATAEEIAELN
jgi:hypothetical protein